MISSEANNPNDLFPKMPKEVFDLWIRPHIPAYGWPFASVKQPLDGTKWKRFFAGGNLEYWATVKWQLTSIGLSKLLLDINTVARIEAVIGFAVFDQKTATSNIENTKTRFWNCVNHILQFGLIRDPVIGVMQSQCLVIVDGHHRLAALSFLNRAKGFRLPIWLGH
jgi:hypothetical protein